MLYDKDIAIQTSKLTQKIRDFFTNQDFLEVSTPIMTPLPGMEPHLTPFETTLNINSDYSRNVYLNTSPELQMKKLISQGFDKIFNITKVFRNFEIGGSRHNPEFTMLEWYRYNSNYVDMMNDTEELIKFLSNNQNITYLDISIDLTSPFKRQSIHSLFLEYCNIDLELNKDFKTFEKTANDLDHNTSACNDWDEIFYKIFLNDIEPKLGFDKPIIIFDYPASQAALAKKKNSNKFWAERFEIYIAGVEIANAFSELIDPHEQRERLLEEQNLRKKLDKTIFDIDEEFLASLESIQKPCSGIALGIDRLFMILLNKKSIEDILLFPMIKMLNQ